MTDKLSQIRRQMPVLEQFAFLNTGSCGPLPEPTAQAVARVTEQEYLRGRADVARFRDVMVDREAVRIRLSRLFNAPPECFALTHHTTDGMNIVTLGFNWQAGDEAATTTIEHEAGLYPLYLVQTRYGVKINFADVGLGEDPLPAIEAALTPRTRLLSISHVSYSSGARFPLEDVIALAHRRGVPVLVDAAQSAGVFPIDLTALEVDYFALPAQKWLCGPDGVGALYVRPDRVNDLWPTFVSYGSFASQDWRGGYTLAPGAARYETGMLYPATVSGWLASLDWLLDTVGPDWAYARIADLSAYARRKLEALDGVRVLTPAQRQASLVNFLPVGWSPARMAGLVKLLGDAGYVIRSIPHAPYCVRVSCGFYNTEAEIDGLCACLADLLKRDPRTVEVPQWAIDYALPDEPVG